MGDHGQRFGPVIELSGQGMFERSNVLMLFSVPKKLRNTPIETMLRENQDKLFTPHDVHATLIDIVRHQPAANFQDTSFMKIKGTMGNSWLRELDPELPRDCRHLPIPSELCPCNYGKEEPISSNNPVWQVPEKELLIENFNQILSENKELNVLCEKAILKNVTSIMKKDNSLKQIQFKVEFFTTRNGQFVAQFKLDERGNLVLYPKEFQRINRYARTADCLIEKLDLRSMCYCKVQPNEAPKKL